jgi:hypothetical protein
MNILKSIPMSSHVLLLAGSIGFLIPLTSPLLMAQSGNQSQLWGSNGKQWNPTRAAERLPDFSYAGYHQGERPIPTVPGARNIKSDYGAKGEGVSDDTAAFRNAIREHNNGVWNGALFIPEGTYVIKDILRITRGNLVLRGEGPTKTVLYFPDSTSVSNQYHQPYHRPGESWKHPGHIHVASPSSYDPTPWTMTAPCADLDPGVDPKLATVTANANRGAKKLKLSTLTGMAVGSSVVLKMQEDANGSLAREVINDPHWVNLPPLVYCGGWDAGFPTKVTAINTATNEITIERPLRLNVRTQWKPAVYKMTTLTEVGIEHLWVKHPNKPYGGHHKEEGYHSIELFNAAHSWIRNVRISDADGAIRLGHGTMFTTVIDTTIDTFYRKNVPSANKGRCDVASSQRSCEPCSGGSGCMNGWPAEYWDSAHYGIAFDGRAVDNLVWDTRVIQEAKHELEIGTAAGNVVAKTAFTAMNTDFHRYYGYENLFTDIDAGNGFLLFAAHRTVHPKKVLAGWTGPAAGARNTWWNVRVATNRREAPPLTVYPQPTFVATDLLSCSPSTPTAWDNNLWRECLMPASIQIQNLYAVQLVKRGFSPPPGGGGGTTGGTSGGTAEAGSSSCNLYTPS